MPRLQEVCQQWKFPLPVYREAQGTFSEFGTEVSLTLEGEAVTFYGRGRTQRLNFTEQILALAEKEAMALGCPMLHSLTVQSSLPEAKTSKTCAAQEVHTDQAAFIRATSSTGEYTSERWPRGV